MAEYKGNSFKVKEEKADKQEKKKLDPVTKGKVKTKKKSGVRKLTDVFISEDIVNVKDYILMDVLLPTVKKAVSDIVTNGIDMMLYGETGRSTRSSSRGSRVSYSRYYERERDRDRRDRDVRSSRSRVGYDYDDIILETRAEAVDVIESLEELIDNYQIASVADLYELVGISGSYTDNKYGWTSLRTASVVRCRDGYLLKMPKAMPLD